MQSKNPSRVVSNKKRDEWREHIKRWESSSLPQAAYCSSAGISYTSFVYWRGVFLAELNPSQRPSPFVPIKLAPLSTTTDLSQQAIQIKLLSGHRVYLPITMNIQDIAALLCQLEVPHA
jgi:hypothetical protein